MSFYDKKDEKDKDQMTKKVTTKSPEVEEMISNPVKSTTVVVPTDKSDSFVTVEKDEYIRWVKDCLSKAATASSREI